MSLPPSLAALAMAGALAATACADDLVPIEPMGPEATEHHLSSDDPIEPIPLEIELDAPKVALGERLFRDPILSPSGHVACTTCHELGRGGVDGRKTSALDGQPPMLVNTPTMFNVAFSYKLHWGGAYVALKKQLDTPITSPRAMATTYDDIVKRLQASAEYRDAFAAIYSDGVTVDSFQDAMVEYERSLFTPNARFDRHLRGEANVLDADELAGYEIFKSHGCISCHQGINIGGNLFQKLGVLGDYFGDRGNVTEADYGRYNVTKKEEDRFVFRVPSLRNVAVTAPYFHDGSAATLEDAVRVMAQYQLGRPLNPEQIRKVVAFLKTLTGEYKGARLQ
jgi:cytochrome c peroxidase